LQADDRFACVNTSFAIKLNLCDSLLPFSGIKLVCQSAGLAVLFPLPAITARQKPDIAPAEQASQETCLRSIVQQLQTNRNSEHLTRSVVP